MKKTIISIVAVALLASVLAFAGAVYAQAGNPPTQTPVPGYGRGMMNGTGRGGMMGGYSGTVDQEGWMHDTMVASLAEKLGLAVEDIDTRLAKGETMLEIATSKGLTSEQFQTWMTEAHAKAIEAAVKNGDLTQEQADWMNQRGGMMNGTGAGRGGMMNGAGRGMRGAGGSGTNTTCPMYNQTNP